jgi:hypothetical protein
MVVGSKRTGFFGRNIDCMMRRARVGFAVMSMLVGVGHTADTESKPVATLEIQLNGYAVWGRYVFSDGRTRRTGWMKASEGKDSYQIQGLAAGLPSRFKAIFYAPGCALQTLDLTIADAQSARYSFRCDPVSQTEIVGVVERLDRLYQHKVTIEAKYVAQWAGDFFGYEDGTSTDIPLGTVATLDEASRFRLAVPDFNNDGIVRVQKLAGEIRLWARDRVSGELVARLRVVPGTRWPRAPGLGGIPIGELGGSPFVFAACAANPPGVHDKFGFATRPEPADACGS